MTQPKRTERVIAMVTAKEKEDIDSYAQLFGFGTTSNYVRKLAIYDIMANKRKARKLKAEAEAEGE